MIRVTSREGIEHTFYPQSEDELMHFNLDPSGAWWVITSGGSDSEQAKTVAALSCEWVVMIEVVTPVLV